MKHLVLFCLSALFIGRASAQDFLNNDLNGVVGSASLPTNWQNVPFTDVNCLASNTGVDTPDVTDATGPSVSNGVMGNPYSGPSFVSALFGGQVPGSFYHEGIMQEVSGFTVGGCYTVNFHQTVVKQLLTDYLDSSGSWAAYLDDDLIGISAPTVSNEPYASTSMPWEFRSFNFVATATTHTVKFLPADDDPDQSVENNPTGGLRMGIDSIYIGTTAIAPLVLDLGSDTALCSGVTMVLDVTNANATYLWQDGSTNPTLSASFPVLQEETFWVEVTGSCGSLRDSVHLYYAESPTVDFGNDTVLCLGETLLLEAVNSNSSYLWHDNSIGSNFTVSQPGTYWLRVNSECGVVSDTIEVSYGPRPEVNLGADTSICAGEIVSLHASTANATYLWQDASEDATLLVTEQGTYWVRVTAGCGSDTDSIVVDVNSLPTVNLGQNTALCQEDSLLLNASTTNASYLWQDNSAEPTFMVRQPGMYWVEVSTDCGMAQDSVLISHAPSPMLDLGEDASLCEEESLLLDVSTANATYLWQNGSPNPTFLVTQPGVYWVKLTTACSATDTIVIDEAVCEVTLEIPNVFTPNGDAVNDFFTPRISEGIISMTTDIYNRWGMKVFSTENLLIEWNAEHTSAGVYYWIIRYSTINGTEDSLHGYLTILR